MRRSLLVALVAALIVVAMGASAAFAGEITGNGKSLKNPDGTLNGRSICAFSGLNDDPPGLDPENGPPGRTQSFGQDVRTVSSTHGCSTRVMSATRTYWGAPASDARHTVEGLRATGALTV